MGMVFETVLLLSPGHEHLGLSIWATSLEATDLSLHGLLKVGNNAPTVVTVLADLVRINPKLAGVWCALFGDGILRGRSR